MGFRWRKSFSSFPGFRLNLSHGGARGQVGGSPLSFSFPLLGGAKQRRLSATLPGSGLSWVRDDGPPPARNSLSPMQLRPRREESPAGDSVVSEDTRRILDRYLALTIKDTRLEADGLRYAFDLHCKECGGFQMDVPDGDADHHDSFCKACGIKFGMLGEIRAYAGEIAAAHRAKQTLRRRSPIMGSKVLIGILAAGAIAGLILHKPAPKAPAPAALVAPVPTLPEPTRQTPRQAVPIDPVIASAPVPDFVIAPLPPPRPGNLTVAPRRTLPAPTR
jgi:hypothetical protein